MKFDMPTCVSILSDDKLESLEMIILKKYKKFIGFYHMIEDQMDDIRELEYENDSDDSELVVNITFDDGVDIDEKVMEIDEYFDTHVSFKDSSYTTSGNQIMVKLLLFED